MSDVLIEPDEERESFGHAAWCAVGDESSFVVSVVNEGLIRLYTEIPGSMSPDEAEHVAALLTSAAHWSRRHHAI